MVKHTKKGKSNKLLEKFPRFCNNQCNNIIAKYYKNYGHLIEFKTY